MVLIAVTGGIGAGKSTVAQMLANRGAAVVDADQIARQILEPTGPSYQALVDHFGPDVVGTAGVLNRAAIAARVFADPSELAVLNAITHPTIATVIGARVSEFAGTDRIVVLDIPLLGPETRSHFGLAGVIVVDAPIDMAVQRLVDHRGLRKADARARVQAQIGREERRRLGDVIIENSGTMEALAADVDRAWAWIENTTVIRDR